MNSNINIFSLQTSTLVCVRTVEFGFEFHQNYSTLKIIAGINKMPNCQLNPTFPQKLFSLMDAESDEIVAWLPHGLAFRVVDYKRFADETMPRYFRHTKLTSFQRQLNLYGFRRVTRGEDQGAYFHQKFQRGRADFVTEIRRLPGKGPSSSSAEYGRCIDNASTSGNMSSNSFSAYKEKSSDHKGSANEIASNSFSYGMAKQSNFSIANDKHDQTQSSNVPNAPKMSKLSMNVGFGRGGKQGGMQTKLNNDSKSLRWMPTPIGGDLNIPQSRHGGDVQPLSHNISASTYQKAQQQHSVMSVMLGNNGLPDNASSNITMNQSHYCSSMSQLESCNDNNVQDMNVNKQLFRVNSLQSWPLPENCEKSYINQDFTWKSIANCTEFDDTIEPCFMEDFDSLCGDSFLDDTTAECLQDLC
eukprot:gene7949-16277_t